MLTSINLQNITPVIDTNKTVKNSDSLGKLEDPFDMSDIKSKNSFESIFSYERKLQEMQSNPDKKANLTEVKPCIEDEELFPSFLKDPVKRGKEKIVMVIYDENGSVIGSVGESGIATFREHLSDVYYKFKKNLDLLAAELEKMGYSVETFDKGKEPTYAEVFELMFGIDYSKTYESEEEAKKSFFC